MTTLEAPTESTPDAAASPDIAARVRHAVSAALDRKAFDVQLLHLEAVTDFTDYFLVCSGANPRQVKAIADNVQRTLRDHKVRPLHVEGERGSQWVLVDYGDFIIHVFLQEVRDVYALERLWSDAPDVTALFMEDAEVVEDSAVVEDASGVEDAAESPPAATTDSP